MDARTCSPPVSWAQRKEVVFVTILLEDVMNPSISFETQVLRFSGKVGSLNHTIPYELNADLYGEIDPETSKYVVKDRQIDITLRKKDSSAPFWPRLLKDVKKPGWLKTDFGRWKDEDEEGAGDDGEESGADFQELLHKMGGPMGNNGDAELNPRVDFDSDDENEDYDEIPKLEG